MTRRRKGSVRTDGRTARLRRTAEARSGGAAMVATCKQEVAFIGRYLASELSSRESAAFECHLSLCPDCVAFLQTYKATVQLTRDFLASGRGDVPDLRLSPTGQEKRSR